MTPGRPGAGGNPSPGFHPGLFSCAPSGSGGVGARRSVRLWFIEGQGLRPYRGHPPTPSRRGRARAGHDSFPFKSPQFTNREVEAVTAPDCAVITVVPVPTAVATPVELLIVATFGLLELHATTRGKVNPPENVPVAVNVCVADVLRAGLAGVMVMDWSVPLNHKSFSSYEDIDDVVYASAPSPPNSQKLPLLSVQLAASDL